MRPVILILAILALQQAVFAQNPRIEAQSVEVKDAVGRILVSKKTGVELALRDLREIEGKVVGLYPTSFAVDVKSKEALFTYPKPKNRNRHILIPYKNVLQLEGKEVLLSFVPDPKESNFASWEDLAAITVGEFVQVNLINGRRTHGVFLKAADSDITILRGNTQISVPRAETARVFRIKGNTSSFVSRLLRGGQKGTTVADDVLPIFDPHARANPAALAIGAVAGALVYIMPKGRATRVLAYSR